jgi:DNA-binding transcriptional regulator of glucitol operon
MTPQQQEFVALFVALWVAILAFAWWRRRR